MLVRTVFAAALVLGAAVAQGEWICGWSDEANSKHYNIEALMDLPVLHDELHDPGDPESYKFTLSVCKNLPTACRTGGGEDTGFFHQVRAGDGQCMGWKGKWGANDPKLKYSALPSPKEGFKIETHSGSAASSCSEGVRKAQVIFECDKDVVTDEDVQREFFVNENSQPDPEDPEHRPFCLYIAHIKSQHACAGSKPPPGSKPDDDDISGLSVGWIVFMAISIPFAVYCLVGCAFNFHKGERGSSMMPNATFWKDLPALVKEGASFSAGKVGSLKSGGKAGTEYSTMESSA